MTTLNSLGFLIKLGFITFVVVGGTRRRTLGARTRIANVLLWWSVRLTFDSNNMQVHDLLPKELSWDLPPHTQLAGTLGLNSEFTYLCAWLLPPPPSMLSQTVFGVVSCRFSPNIE